MAHNGLSVKIFCFQTVHLHSLNIFSLFRWVSLHILSRAGFGMTSSSWEFWLYFGFVFSCPLRIENVKHIAVYDLKSFHGVRGNAEANRPRFPISLIIRAILAAIR